MPSSLKFNMDSQVEELLREFRLQRGRLLSPATLQVGWGGAGGRTTGLSATLHATLHAPDRAFCPPNSKSLLTLNPGVSRSLTSAPLPRHAPLLPHTRVQGLAARYTNPFQHMSVENQLVPALLLPPAAGAGAEVEERVSLLQVGLDWYLAVL